MSFPRTSDVRYRARTHQGPFTGQTEAAMAEEPDAYGQAEQELVRQGRPRPQGDYFQWGLTGGGIALAAAFPLVLIIGRHDSGDAWDFDREAMWIVVFGVAAASFAIRYYREWAWSRDWLRRVHAIREELARKGVNR